MKKFPAKTLLAAAAIIALAGGFVVSLSAKPMAPAVQFTSLNGEKLTMADLRGKVVLVNFWATDCPGCVAEMPDLIKTQQKYQAAGLTTVAVAMPHDRPDYVVSYTQKNALPFFVTLDPTGQLGKAFNNVQLTPTTFVIDKQGRILQRTVGVLDFAKLDALIEKELGHQPS